VSQRPVDDVGQDGLDDGVLPVGDVGLRRRLGAVGEERVVSPDREQLIELGAVTDSTHDQPRGDRRLGRRECGELNSATSASLISSPVSGSTTAPG
jgi:hypothetical protein